MAVQAPKIEVPVAAPSALRAWAPTLLGITAICAIFGFVFQYEIRGAIRVWNGSTAYNHCYLVLPLAATLLWMRRDLIARLRPAPSWWPLLLLPPASAAWLAAALLDISEGAQLSVVLLFEILLLALLGWRVFRALMAPLLFLFFLVPFGEFLVPTLQTFTAIFTVWWLHLLNIPVFADGYIIQIPAGTFEVAEACAGLRFLIASIVFGCFFATIVYRSKWRRALFIALSIILPIIANGFRALGLVLLGHLMGNAASVAADHVLYGWLFFTIVTLVLIAIGVSFREPAEPSLPPLDNTPVARSQLGPVLAIGLLLALAGPAFFYWAERAAAAPLPTVAAPAFATPPDDAWMREPVAAEDWQPEAIRAERTLIATYRRGSAAVTEFIAFYPVPARGNPLTRTAKDVVEPEPWRLVANGRLPVSLGGRSIAVNTAKIARDGDQQRLVWWFYVIDGRPTGSILEAKLLQAAAALRTERQRGALVALSIPITDDAEPGAAALRAFVEKLAPL